MGRTLPSITQAFLQEQQSLARFRRALRREDQRALDPQVVASRHHLAAAPKAPPVTCKNFRRFIPFFSVDFSSLPDFSFSILLPP